MCDESSIRLDTYIFTNFYICKLPVIKFIIRSNALLGDNSPKDMDGDSIPDEWESNGMDVNNDGKIDLDLRALGANPEHKDLFVEVDYLKDRKPDEKALTKVVDLIQTEQVCNPDADKE